MGYIRRGLKRNLESDFAVITALLIIAIGFLVSGLGLSGGMTGLERNGRMEMAEEDKDLGKKLTEARTRLSNQIRELLVEFEKETGFLPTQITISFERKNAHSDLKVGHVGISHQSLRPSWRYS